MTTAPDDAAASELIVLGAGQGRSYDCGPTMHAQFKADGVETGDTYSISEWTLEPGCAGVGAHTHDSNDDTFYVVSGRATFVLDGERVEAGPGTFVRVPPGVEHDYRNEGAEPVRLLNIYVPGGFEQEMPGISAWFAEHPD
jgi:mannose-6-phosphate isomerase-like protein (cupin superfamily)